MIIYGINPVLEALRAGRVTELRVGDRADDRLKQLLALAAERGVRVKRVPADVLERESRRGVHQGVLADVEKSDDYSVDQIVGSASGAPLVVVLDGIEDPHNLGAILRTADAAGVDGVVIQSRRSAARDGVAAKASAGALAHVKIAEVVNIARAVEELKEAGVWTVGLAGEGPEPYNAVDFTLPTAVVLGAEGAGLRRLVRERCDRLASIPMRGHVSSLNVSVAAGIVLFEALRQRSAAVGGGRKK
ncbi:MAG TPA: 23S rRNA (guanosine(2251)-2'-O)-methyltransferase RlmB [Vicinamibacterales bacterium]|nr:23S rRNA (guanosine(2251)-2'-O)-methyltransferase RlmB [Vicinamibacterales bacterium]